METEIMKSLERKQAGSFFSTLRMWGSLPTSRMEDRGLLSFVSTGVPIADQNYVFGTPGDEQEKDLERAISFFRLQGTPFTWWITPSFLSPGFEDILRGRGFLKRCSPPEMVLDMEKTGPELPLPAGADIFEARSDPEARAWARLSLEGFDSGPEFRPSFSNFAASLVSRPFSSFFRMLLLSLEGRGAASVLLSLAGKNAGLHYFSVLPSFRGRGLGQLLLKRAIREARREGRRYMELQSSPMGLPLYKKTGFRELFRFSVYSSDPEAC